MHGEDVECEVADGDGRGEDAVPVGGVGPGVARSIEQLSDRRTERRVADRSDARSTRVRLGGVGEERLQPSAAAWHVLAQCRRLIDAASARGHRVDVYETHHVEIIKAGELSKVAELRGAKWKIRLGEKGTRGAVQCC